MSAKFLSAAILVTIVVVCLGLEILHAELVYDDWTCAFAKCVKVKEAR